MLSQGYNPQTLESRIIATAVSDIPVGWQRGMKPKYVRPKESYSELEGNTRKWKVLKDGVEIWRGENLSAWAKLNGVVGLKYNTRRFKHAIKMQIPIVYSDTKTVVLDSIDTGLCQVDFCYKYEYTPSFISTVVKRGCINQRIVSIYSAEQITTK